MTQHKIDLGQVDRATAEMICQFLRRLSGGSHTDSSAALMERLKAFTENKVGAESLLMQYDGDGELMHLRGIHTAAYIADDEHLSTFEKAAIDDLVGEKKREGTYRED